MIIATCQVRETVTGNAHPACQFSCWQQLPPGGKLIQWRQSGKRVKSMNHITRFRRAINNFLQYPAYPAYSLRPDTFFSAKVYFFLGFIFHPIEFFKRKIFVSRLPATEIKIDRDKGYLILDHKDFPEIGPMVKYAQDLFYREKERILGGDHRKKFLIQRWLGAEENHELIWKFATNKKLLSLMSDYLGYVPLLGSSSLMYSPNVDMEAGRSQMYHMDGEDIRQLKIFVYLNDVDEATGPLTFLPAKISKKYFKLCSRLLKCIVATKKSQTKQFLK